ncbi:DUF3099 domain-containing protein [Phycicoccus sp. BSK3Z-2]|uniref:DUF3099 domain-containing protein n=1 Tax=Phycicoccus avicenniae TaxID=2828860 RepID=A0A941HZJ9_9MICO|nr:DUF3099 domain-containing protein [Phycicoccus avicenniae]MBR7742249.1 DUF3099 domain-containing protein [Phycicoccus avicenniae]
MAHRTHVGDTQSVTSVAESPEADRADRIRKYLFTMSLRTVCFVLAIVFDGWLRWVFAAGAVFLPFFAVVAANAVRPRVGGRYRPVTPTRDETPRITDRSYVHVPTVVTPQDDEDDPRSDGR